MPSRMLQLFKLLSNDFYEAQKRADRGLRFLYGQIESLELFCLYFPLQIVDCWFLCSSLLFIEARNYFTESHLRLKLLRNLMWYEFNEWNIIHAQLECSRGVISHFFHFGHYGPIIYINDFISRYSITASI